MAVGFGVVGLGMGASRAKTITQTPGARLVAVADLKEERVNRVSAELGCEGTRDYRRLLDRSDIDVIMAMTPSGLHGDVALDAIAAGKHAITTKPMDVSLEKADRMIAAADTAGRKLAVDFGSRYDPMFVRIRRAVEDGTFGRLILGEARLKWYRSQEYYSGSGWRGTWAYDGGGSLSNQTVHYIDLLQWFMGEAESVTAQVGIFAHDIETEDCGMAMLRFKNGALGCIVGTTTFPKTAYSGIELHGDRAGVLATKKAEGEWFFADGVEERLPEPGPHFRSVIEDMVSALERSTPLACDGREGRKSLAILDAIYRSAREEKRVEVR
jgi:UDP-N-acetyl-2-amino-2-deoxyglucuronate dehydrogenase